MKALQCPFVLPEVNKLMILKLKVTLSTQQFDECCLFLADFNWMTALMSAFQEVQIHTRVIWWKTVCGAWTTSHRMHEDNQKSCVYGCIDCKDTLCHYLECPVLWQLAREVTPLEATSSPAGRLSLVVPSKQSLNRLAVAFNLYHNTKNDHLPFDYEFNFSVPNFVQHRASAVALSLRSQFNN